MPNIKSAIKRVRTSTRQHDRNVAYRSAMKTALRSANKAIADKAAEASAPVLNAVATIDKLASKGIIHPNTAARKKSRLVRKLNFVSKEQ